LLVSQTPAIANFGLTISLGLFFCFLLGPWAIARPLRGQESAL
jgi:predicted exporter